ncbi:MAG: hypothetical protein HXY45_18850 [Syntrophaceae bacterium]|nr:hypothetical protein [Syntrophaceae bacterium]
MEPIKRIRYSWQEGLHIDSAQNNIRLKIGGKFIADRCTLAGLLTGCGKTQFCQSLRGVPPWAGPRGNLTVFDFIFHILNFGQVYKMDYSVQQGGGI